MSKAYLGLGSNIGDRNVYLQKALQLLKSHQQIKIIQMSSIYETEPFGYINQPDFLNMVVSIETSLEPKQLLEAIQIMEKTLHRERNIHWGPRTIDIDILLYDQLIIHSKDLTIPHLYISERLFVLIPLSEIYNGKIPDRSKDIKQMIQELGDKEGIKKWQG